MNAKTEQKTPEQLEDEIAQIRSSLDDTLDAIQRKLSPGPLMNQVWDYLKSGPVDFSGNLGATIRDNPVPVSLLGIGLAWLMMSRPDGRAERTAHHSVPGLDTNFLAYGYASPRDEDEQHLGESADPMAGDYDESYDSNSYRRIMAEEEIDPDQMAESSEAEYFSSTGSSTGRFRRAGQGARRARARVGRMAHDAGGRLSGGVRSARHAAGEFGHEWGDRFGHLTRDQAARAREGYQHMLHERPLVLGAIGVALGAAIGAALPSTRREDELMGRARDDLLNKAEVAGREQLDKAGHVAGAAGEAAQDAARDVKDAAREEADHQGYSKSQHP